MIVYTDFGPYKTKEELNEQLRTSFPQFTGKFISIETLSNGGDFYLVRVWWSA